MRPITGLSAALCCLALALPAFANEPAKTQAAAAETPAPQVLDDQGFVNRAGQLGAATVNAGKRAMALSSAQKVKDYGRQMLKEHAKLTAELRAIAAKAGLQAPDETPDPATMTKLSGLTGTDLDKAYVEAVALQAHADMVTLFATHAEKARNPALKSWAKRSLVTLQRHLNMGQKLAKDSSLTVQPSDAGQMNRN